MDLKEYVVTIVPPLVAIFTQWIPFPTERSLEKQAKDLTAGRNYPESVEQILASQSKGAVVAASMVPTAISFFAAIALLFYTHADGVPWMVVCFGICAVIFVSVYQAIDRYELCELDDMPWIVSNWFPRFKRGRLVDFAMTGINLIVIGLATLLQLHILPKLM